MMKFHCLQIFKEYITQILCVISTENFKPHQMQSPCLNNNERDICTFLNCCEQSSNSYYHTNRLLETKRVWNIMNINMLRICSLLAKKVETN